MAKKRLSFEKIDRSGIPLKEVIAAHAQFCKRGSLSKNLGDGFLLAHNPIFCNVREEVLARGFYFSHEDHVQYDSFPLMSLDGVIEKKCIPYLANSVWLKLLEKSAPGKFSLTELKRSELRFNYLFHESAHCIAHSVFFGNARFARIPKNADSLLKILLGEAFANTVECLSSAFAIGEMGSYFLDANCHFRSNAKEVLEIQRCARRFGWEKTARVLLAAFLYANFLYEHLGRKELLCIRAFAGLENGASIDKLAKIGTQLSESFRTTTTHLHLIKLGFPAELGRLMGVEPLENLLRKAQEPLKERCYGLAAIAVRGLDSKDP